MRFEKQKKFKETCSKCGDQLDKSRIGKQSYCRRCKSEYTRLHRKKHSELTDEERKRSNARSYANQYLRRGRITKKPCEKCGSTYKLQMHHDDYDKPLDIKWLCKDCHLEIHNKLVVTEPSERQRKERGQRKEVCSGCGDENDRLPQRYCKKCHKEYMRTYRGKENQNQ